MVLFVIFMGRKPILSRKVCTYIVASFQTECSQALKLPVKVRYYVTDYVPQSLLCYQNVLGYHMCAVQ